MVTPPRDNRPVVAWRLNVKSERYEGIRLEAGPLADLSAGKLDLQCIYTVDSPHSLKNEMHD